MFDQLFAIAEKWLTIKEKIKMMRNEPIFHHIKRKRADDVASCPIITSFDWIGNFWVCLPEDGRPVERQSHLLLSRRPHGAVSRDLLMLYPPISESLVYLLEISRERLNVPESTQEALAGSLIYPRKLAG